MKFARTKFDNPFVDYEATAENGTFRIRLVWDWDKGEGYLLVFTATGEGTFESLSPSVPVPDAQHFRMITGFDPEPIPGKIEVGNIVQVELTKEQVQEMFSQDWLSEVMINTGHNYQWFIPVDWCDDPDKFNMLPSFVRNIMLTMHPDHLFLHLY